MFSTILCMKQQLTKKSNRIYEENRTQNEISNMFETNQPANGKMDNE